MYNLGMVKLNNNNTGGQGMKTKTHKQSQQIECQPLQEWCNEAYMTYARSIGKVNKSLRVTLLGNYEVYHNGEMVFSGIQANPAVRAYNKI